MKTAIVPVPFWQEFATIFLLQSGQLTPPPWYAWQLTNESGKIFASGTIQMTEANWSAWPANADDTEYQLNAITSQLGLVRA